MKSLSSIAILLFAAGPVFADVEVTMTEVRRLGFLPQDKADYKPEEKIDFKKANPFAEKTKKVEAKSDDNSSETEESKIRAYLKKQTVSGIAKLGDKYVATVGRLVMEAGQTLPPLIQGQTQILRVMKVDKGSVELGWVEGSPYDTAAPRRIVLKVDMNPYVEVHLASSEGNAQAKSTYLIDGNNKLFVPPVSNLMPDPSEIAENLPPGSNVNPNAVLSAEEETQIEFIEKNAEESTGVLPAADGGAKPPLEDTGEGAPASPGSDQGGGGKTSPDVPPLPVEDEVQKDPDLVPPSEGQ